MQLIFIVMARSFLPACPAQATTGQIVLKFHAYEAGLVACVWPQASRERGHCPATESAPRQPYRFPPQPPAGSDARRGSNDAASLYEAESREALGAAL